MAGTPRSCTACRQAKVGCDARKKPANTPCTRCAKNQLECRFDKNFKRILTRKLTASLTNELHQLRTSQPAFEGGQLSPAGIQLREPEALAARDPFFHSHAAESLPVFSLGNVTVPAGTIVELVQYFGRQYYAYTPFLQPIESLACFYTASPLLFWTIILVASHLHPDHGGLHEQLLSPHEELLRPFSNTAIQSIHEIHALLIMCLWPTPKRPEWTSPTWNYICLAVGACMRLDLDKTVQPDAVEPRLDASGDGRRAEEASKRTRKMTWLACFAISTQEATFLGLLPPLSARPHIKHSRRAMDEVKVYLLPGYRPRFAIYEIICNYCLVMEEIDGSVAQLSLAETFEDSLDRIKQTYSAEWTTDVDMLLQYAKMNLNATALMRIVVENGAGCTDYLASLQPLIIRGSEASSRLISDVKTIIHEALAREGQSDNNVSIPNCYPRYYFELIFFAAVFIFRTAYMRPSTDRDAAIQGLVEVYNIYRLFPRHPDVTLGADAIYHVLHYANSEEFSYPSSPMGDLATTHRLGASFVWDTLKGLIQLTGDEKFTAKIVAKINPGAQESRGLRSTLTAPSTAVQTAVIPQAQVAPGALPLPINLDWGDIDLSLPTFDIFGLDAGGHIAW